ncbi:DUF262 domain-containing protein [Hymenobacter sp. BT175]|uniref:DUF262 domain-containing protein n=1 Tax=Hymenobacter translucens TaxID=2886507 RepID=UPI001D0DC75D|nr:DUF262 domain-containing protein [Hymenobacter translucens]MCC2548517.1 DUF262 domain-containing protein [Hymenobacter translucens]
MRKYNLEELLAGEIGMAAQEPISFAGVQVPMIQRDYAQGRKSEEAVRSRFLSALFGALGGNNQLTLDFVYGSVQLLDKKPYFVPLDGQQRLTTLFLLYWYIGNRELTGEHKTRLNAWLGKFSYATRSTARDFCAKLTSVDIDPASKPSQTIRNLAWFYSSYQQDPTVQAMLEMLDAIHKRYVEAAATDLFPALKQLSFYVLPLDGFGLSDELYIKMNARGKQLTGFENFKADFIDWLRADTNPEREEFAEPVALDGRSIPFVDAFTIKLDTTWTDLFWRNTRVDNTVDAAYMRFWQRFLLTMHYVDPEQKGNSLAEILDNSANSDPYKGFALYGALLAKPGRVKAAAWLLDKLVDNYDAIGVVITESWGEQSNSWHLLAASITQQQRILFYAVIRYLEAESFDQQTLRQWLRVIWNISVDPEMRSIEAMVAVMRVVGKLASGAGNIYEFLLSDECANIINAEGSRFIKARLTEERTKAQLIQDDAAWEALLVVSEKHPLFQGSIQFLLLGELTIDRFQHRVVLAEHLFSARGTQSFYRENHLLLRATISAAPKWNHLRYLEMRDDADNWRLLLRKPWYIQGFIAGLVDLESEEAIKDELNHLVTQRSTFSSSREQRHMHEHLYLQADLQNWMQSSNVDATVLRERYEHVFAHKYYGRDYTRVRLDTYRNELANGLITHLGFTTGQRCGTSNCFWGDTVTLSRGEGDWTITALFNVFQTLYIGVLRSDGLVLTANESVSEAQQNEYWLLRKPYVYKSVSSAEEASEFIQGIKEELFDSGFFQARINVQAVATTS